MQFWEDCYQSGRTLWDKGRPNPLLDHWIRTGKLSPITDSDARPGSNDDSRVVRVLVPGCGAGHEVVLLAEWGFDVLGLDYAPAAVSQARDLLRSLLTSTQAGRVVRAEILQADLFEYHTPLAYDAVYDQQCLVALHPSRWSEYAARLHSWLRPGGRFYLVLNPALTAEVAAMQAKADEPRRGPPYDCSIEQLQQVFSASAWDWPESVSETSPVAPEQLGLILTRV